MKNVLVVVLMVMTAMVACVSSSHRSFFGPDMYQHLAEPTLARVASPMVKVPHSAIEIRAQIVLLDLIANHPDSSIQMLYLVLIREHMLVVGYQEKTTNGEVAYVKPLPSARFLFCVNATIFADPVISQGYKLGIITHEFTHLLQLLKDPNFVDSDHIMDSQSVRRYFEYEIEAYQRECIFLQLFYPDDADMNTSCFRYKSDGIKGLRHWYAGVLMRNDAFFKWHDLIQQLADQ